VKPLVLTITVVWVSLAAPGYTGSKVCARCHSAIYSKYLNTAMGRSVVRAQETRRLGPIQPVRITESGITYELSRQGDDLYQTEYRQNGSGQDVFRASWKLEYAIGSGANGITYAIRRGNYLFEAPLSYYAKTHSWELSPGDEKTSTGFSRLVPEGCIACHSGRARPAADNAGLYLDPPFAEMAIGCENCHGPGEFHASHPAKGTIVNPARLSPRRASDICMNCHEAGDTRTFQPGRTSADFRPGESLSDTVAILKIPPRPADASKDLLEHNFSMMLSRCYRASNGRMGCLTCHDPHASASGTSSSPSYNAKCLTCHTDSSCRLAVALRAREASGCIGCHMPKANIGFIAHSALTNHRVVRKTGEPFPEEAYHLTAPDLPDLIYVNRTREKPLTPLMLLQAYGELSDRAPEYRDRYLQTLGQFPTQGDIPLINAALGLKASREGAPAANVIAWLSKAVDEGFKAPSVFEALATALSTDGRGPEAIAVLKRGIELSPWEPRLQKLLALEYIHAKQYDLAREALRQYLKAFPEDQFVRDLLKKVAG
jgi:hypothetical protein